MFCLDTCLLWSPLHQVMMCLVVPLADCQWMQQPRSKISFSFKKFLRDCFRKKDRNIKALRRLHLLPFTRKQKIISDLAGLLAYSVVEAFPSRDSGMKFHNFNGAYSYGDSVRLWLTSLLISLIIMSPTLEFFSASLATLHSRFYSTLNKMRRSLPWDCRRVALFYCINSMQQ